MSTLGYVCIGIGILLYWLLGYYIWKQADYDPAEISVGRQYKNFKEFLYHIRTEDVFLSLIAIPALIICIIILLGYTISSFGGYIKKEIKLFLKKKKKKKEVEN